MRRASASDIGTSIAASTAPCSASALIDTRSANGNWTCNSPTISSHGSRLHGLSLLFQVYNLNNEPFRTTVSDSNGMLLTFPEEYTEYGRQYLLGFRYSLQ